MIQEFYIKGIARPSVRPRVYTHNGITRGVKSKDDSIWQDSIIRQVQAQKPYCFERAVPIKIVFFAFYKKPKKSEYKTAISHSIGDCDNISKNIQDALQSRTVKIGKLRVKQKGICFEDDSQIVRLVAHKTYTDLEDYVIVRITDEINNRETEWL